MTGTIYKNNFQNIHKRIAKIFLKKSHSLIFFFFQFEFIYNRENSQEETKWLLIKSATSLKQRNIYKECKVLPCKATVQVYNWLTHLKKGQGHEKNAYITRN